MWTLNLLVGTSLCRNAHQASLPGGAAEDRRPTNMCTKALTHATNVSFGLKRGHLLKQLYSSTMKDMNMKLI